MNYMKYSACIEMLFTEQPFLQRIKKAKESGFQAIEFWDWKEKDLQKIKDECMANDIKVAAFVGNTAGQMVNPEDNESFIKGVKESIEKAVLLGCENLILTTNILGEDRSVKPLKNEIPDSKKKENILYILSELDEIVKKNGITLNIEPLNVIVDHKGYFLNNSTEGFEALKKINRKNIKLLYDIYHMQIMEGNLINTITENIDIIGHIHIADVPGRHEPGTGEINYNNIFKILKEIEYKNWVGFEYLPSGSTELSLRMVRKIFEF